MFRKTIESIKAFFNRFSRKEHQPPNASDTTEAPPTSNAGIERLKKGNEEYGELLLEIQAKNEKAKKGATELTDELMKKALEESKKQQ